MTDISYPVAWVRQKEVLGSVFIAVHFISEEISIGEKQPWEAVSGFEPTSDLFYYCWVFNLFAIKHPSITYA